MATFIINTKAELMKSRRTAAYWLTIIAGLLIPVLITSVYLIRAEVFSKKLGAEPWLIYLDMCWKAAAAFLLPMYAVLVTSLVVQTEYRNNTWKQIYTTPRSYADIFFSKFTVVQLLILGCLLLFHLAILFTGYLIDLLNSDFRFFESPVPWKNMLNIAIRMYIASLGLTALQYWLSLRFKNYIVSVSIGLALLLITLMFMEWENIFYFPYAAPAFTYFFKRSVMGIAVHEWYSLIWMAVALGLGFLNIVKRKEHG